MPRIHRRHDARAIANSFLEFAAGEGRAIDHLKIQKLTYFAHGWHLAVTGRPLVTQTVLAWPYGPVFRQIYDEFKLYGRDTIDGRATYLDEELGEWMPFEANLEMDSDQVLERVWDVYKKYSGLQMSAMAHAEGTPWYQTVGHLKPSEIRDIPIPNLLIREHYVKLAKERQGVNRTPTASAPGLIASRCVVY